MKRIVYLSFYFEPDLCAGSFRNSPLAIELASQVEGEAIVEVYTTLPNRYNSFSPEAPEYEERGNLKIHRIALPKHKSGMVDQIRSFTRYFLAVRKLNRNQNADLVFASSSRLFTAYLGSVLSRKLKAPLYLDIRDLFVDTISDVLKSKMAALFLMPPLKWIEKKTFESANHINVISGGFKSYFKGHPKPVYSNFSNGIDEEFIEYNPSEVQSESGSGDVKTILYAGNIGEGQGLHRIIPETAKAVGKDFKFVVIGDGGMKPRLQKSIEEFGVDNVELRDPIPRNELIEAYKSADYLFLHLNDYPAFRKVLPSKIFEMAALNKPILAGVSGYAAEFLQREVTDSYLFEPCNPSELIEILRNSDTEKVINREQFISNHKRSTINQKMAESIRWYF